MDNLKSQTHRRDVRREGAQGEPTHPPYSYKDFKPRPSRVYTRHEEEADEMAAGLNGPLGFDLEWKVTFRKGLPPRRTAVVQLCDRRIILLIQISAMKRFPQKVKEIIESPDIIKTGANILNDGQKLFRDYGIKARNLVELGGLALQADPSFNSRAKKPIVSLAKVTEWYTGRTLLKGSERTGNWETVPLSEKQLEYAANDAHCALMVYHRLVAMAVEGAITLTPAAYTSQVITLRPLVNVPVSAATTTVGTAQAPVKSLPPRGVSNPGVAPTVICTTAPTATGGGVARTAPTDANSTCTVSVRVHQRAQHIRAYNLWHHKKLPLTDICGVLRSKDNPLKESTVISYVVGALEADAQLPYSYDRLVTLIQMEAGSWTRHREFLLGCKGGSLFD